MGFQTGSQTGPVNNPLAAGDESAKNALARFPIVFVKGLGHTELSCPVAHPDRGGKLREHEVADSIAFGPQVPARKENATLHAESFNGTCEAIGTDVSFELLPGISRVEEGRARGHEKDSLRAEILHPGIKRPSLVLRVVPAVVPSADSNFCGQRALVNRRILILPPT